MSDFGNERHLYSSPKIDYLSLKAYFDLRFDFPDSRFGNESFEGKKEYKLTLFIFPIIYVAFIPVTSPGMRSDIIFDTSPEGITKLKRNFMKDLNEMEYKGNAKVLLKVSSRRYEY